MSDASGAILAQAKLTSLPFQGERSGHAGRTPEAENARCFEPLGEKLGK